MLNQTATGSAPAYGVRQIAHDPATRADRATAVAFDNLSMTYPDGTEALQDITLTIREGEFVSFIGPSGCGKSTLARIASGLLQHTGGTVRIDREHLAFVFQEATLLPWRKTLQNVELMMELRGVRASERRRKALEQMEAVGLKGFEDRFPRALSGGMKMRASLARSLTLDPTVFLFDEPFGALDEITRERLIEDLSALHREKGFTGFFITHSIPEAVYLSDRVVVMSARPGRIHAEFEVNLPSPRTHAMRFEAPFTDGCALVSESLQATMHDTGED